VTEKAEWRNILNDVPVDMRDDYESYQALVDKDGVRIATIEQFAVNPKCFYANTAHERSGCCGSLERARQWCEHKTFNKVN
jgi:hypothetical protein